MTLFPPFGAGIAVVFVERQREYQEGDASVVPLSCVVSLSIGVAVFSVLPLSARVPLSVPVAVSGAVPLSASGTVIECCTGIADGTGIERGTTIGERYRAAERYLYRMGLPQWDEGTDIR